MASLSTTGFSYNSVTTTGSTLYNDEEYPVNLRADRAQYGDIKGIESENQDTFFQKGAGWYEITLEHRSSTELDSDRSDLTSNPKVIKTKNNLIDYEYPEKVNLTKVNKILNYCKSEINDETFKRGNEIIDI